jgi:hypothetical protein
MVSNVPRNEGDVTVVPFISHIAISPFVSRHRAGVEGRLGGLGPSLTARPPRDSRGQGLTDRHHIARLPELLGKGEQQGLSGQPWPFAALVRGLCVLFFEGLGDLSHEQSAVKYRIKSHS